MTDFNNISVKDFLWHFGCLQTDTHPVRMVGSRPDGQGTPTDGQAERIYDGRDAQEALGLAQAWNSEGFNIDFEAPNLKDCMGCKWMAIQAHVDYRLVSKLSAISRVMEINKAEFHGKANILDAGNMLWFFIRMPDHPFKTASESLRFMKSVTDYCTGLGIKWDQSTHDDLAFCIDAIDFFPIARMPAAGMLRHTIDRSYQTGWLGEREESSPSEIIDRISGAVNTAKIMEQAARDQMGSDVIRKSALMKINNGFTQEIFFRLLKNHEYLVCTLSPFRRPDLGPSGPGTVVVVRCPLHPARSYAVRCPLNARLSIS